MSDLFDMSHPESVVIQVVMNQKARRGWEIHNLHILDDGSEFLGAGSMDHVGGYFHYTLKDILPDLEEGYYTIIGVTADSRLAVDEDDLIFHYESYRAATEDEIKCLT